MQPPELCLTRVAAVLFLPTSTSNGGIKGEEVTLWKLLLTRDEITDVSLRYSSCLDLIEGKGSGVRLYQVISRSRGRFASDQYFIVFHWWRSIHAS